MPVLSETLPGEHFFCLRRRIGSIDINDLMGKFDVHQILLVAPPLDSVFPFEQVLIFEEIDYVV
ncbi:MAG TPA: hypothetical protein DCW29_01345 [Janthinobacterium sp.]|nr:hypothetical protein [Janthinobacterium sp.]